MQSSSTVRAEEMSMYVSGHSTDKMDEQLHKQQFPILATDAERTMGVRSM
jgi:hypothetical protein